MMENSTSDQTSNVSSKEKVVNDENNTDLHNNEQQIILEPNDMEMSIVPSSGDLLAWCLEKTAQLDMETKSALSKAKEVRCSGKSEKNSDELSINKNCTNHESPFQFEGDYFYFEQNKHPSIRRMLKVSAETGVHYDIVFHRLSQLRFVNNIICPLNDTCERVLKYFDPKTVYNIPSVEDKLKILHEEFKNLGYARPVLSTGYAHLLADKVFLPPIMIREYYFNWYANSHKSGPDISLLIVEEEKILSQEREHQNQFQSSLADHDYGKLDSSSSKVRSLLRIIKKKPDLSVADAVILSRLYKLDIKFIQKMIQKDEDVLFTVQHAGDKIMHFQEQCIPLQKSSEVIHVSSLDDNVQRVKVEDTNEVSSNLLSNKSTTSMAPSMNEYDANNIVVAQYEDVVDYDTPHSLSDEIKTEAFDGNENSCVETRMSSDRYPKDFIYFEQNRHPSIQEMINISKLMRISYREVFYRFRDFRNAFREHCPEGDICRKVHKLFAHRAVFDGILDATSVNLMYRLFEHFGHVGKNPDIGYTHMIAERVDLPAFIVREQYKEWYSDTDESKSVGLSKHCETIHQYLEHEFGFSSRLSYERLVHLANKYQTTQRVVLNFYDCFIKNIIQSENEMLRYQASAGSGVSEVIPNHQTYNECLNSLVPDHLEPNSPSTSDLSRFSDSEPPKLEDSRLYLLKSSANEEGDKGNCFDSTLEEEQTIKNCFYEASDGSMHNLFKMTASSTGTESKSENVQRARKMTFNMKRIHSYCSPHIKRMKSNFPKPEVSIDQTETDDEEIDIVGLDKIEKNTQIDEPAKAIVQSHPNIYEFPGNLEEETSIPSTSTTVSSIPSKLNSANDEQGSSGPKN